MVFTQEAKSWKWSTLVPSGGDYLSVRNIDHTDAHHISHCRLNGETWRSPEWLPATCWVNPKSLEHKPGSAERTTQSFTAVWELGAVPPLGDEEQWFKEETFADIKPWNKPSCWDEPLKFHSFYCTVSLIQSHLDHKTWGRLGLKHWAGDFFSTMTSRERREETRLDLQHLWWQGPCVSLRHSDLAMYHVGCQSCPIRHGWSQPKLTFRPGRNRTLEVLGVFTLNRLS